MFQYVRGLVWIAVPMLAMAIWNIAVRLIYGVWQPISCGLFLGSMAAAINVFHLLMRVNRLGEFAEKNVFTSASIADQRRARTLGFASRASIALIAAATALKYPHLFDVKYTIIGLTWVPFAAYLLTWWNHRRLSQKV